ncbi:MAG: sugar nucleotide-binding protein, partial [Candidatus Tectomicrobia bacterium]|nr:sugar nucleotide-binding protein [Candidatus Tectomicrobia bacterium]
MMKRVLITGVTSLHGWPLYKALTQQMGAESVLGICPPKTKLSLFSDENVIPCCINEVEELDAIFTRFQPTHVIHAAGMCDLDVCELWPSLAYKRNVEGTQQIVKLSRDCYVMYLSTDLVFSGNHPPRDGYSENDPVDPVSMIGKTFIQAERAVAQLSGALIVRKGLPMGPSISGRKGPIDYLSHRFSRGKPLTLFYDEWRSTLYIEDLIQGLLNLWERHATGYYHLGGPKKVSLYDIGRYLIRTQHYDPACLIKASRFEDTTGLPRIGDVALNSAKA